MSTGSLFGKGRAIEPLESRIAPARYFFGAGDFSIETVAGDDAASDPAELAAAALAGSTRAVFLRAGDRLDLDVSDDGGAHRFVPATGDRPLIAIDAGSALAFFTDLDADSQFDADELTGLAVSDRFSGRVFGDINGSVATLLDAAGELTIEMQRSLIAGLSVTGRIAGDLAAGGNIAGVRIGRGELGPLGGTENFSVQSITAGSAAGSVIGFDGSAETFLATPVELPAGVRGANISDIFLEAGAHTIVAGNGTDSATGPGGPGGSIRGLTIENGFDGVQLTAGTGGSGLGAGGAGGRIVDVDLTLNSPPQFGSGSAIVLQGGNGGGGTTASGAGGSIVRAKVFALDEISTLEVRGGLAGAIGSEGGGLAGAGGSVSASRFNLAGGASLVAIAGGAGGSIDSGRRGRGAGGDVEQVVLESLNANALVDLVQIAGGAGGSAQGPSGRGGDVSDLTMRLTARLGAVLPNGEVSGGSVEIIGGDGTAGRGANGRGGDIRGANLEFLGPVHNASIALRGGAGGTVIERGSAGRGGNVADVRMVLGEADVFGPVISIDGGAPGIAVAGEAGTGGAGGSVRDIGVHFADPGSSGAVRFFAAPGGDGGVSRRAGDGGSVSRVRVEGATETTLRVEVLAGGGGNASSFGASSPGGDGGSIRGFEVEAHFLAALDLSAGRGGNAFFDGEPAHEAAARGGEGGDVSGVKVRAIPSAAPVLESLLVFAGDGGEVENSGRFWGARGSLASLDFEVGDVENSVAFVAGQDGATDLIDIVPRRGGSVTGLRFTSNEIKSDLNVSAAQGGFIDGARFDIERATQGATISGGEGNLVGAGGRLYSGWVRNVFFRAGVPSEEPVAVGAGFVEGAGIERLTIDAPGTGVVLNSNGVVRQSRLVTGDLEIGAVGGISGLEIESAGAVSIANFAPPDVESGRAPDGPSISDIDLTVIGPDAESVLLSSGGGGSIVGGEFGLGGAAGDGGDLRNITIRGFASQLVSLDLFAGAGGLGTLESARGGDGGNVQNVRLINALSGGNLSVQILGGDAGSGTDARGGEGGDVMGVKIEDSGGVGAIQLRGGIGLSKAAGDVGRVFFGSIAAHPTILAATGGAGENNARGGNVHDVELDGLGAEARLAGGLGGSGESPARGGSVVRVKGAIGVFSAMGGDGGRAGDGADAGADGGDVREIDLTRMDRFARLLAGGDGGIGPQPGRGGSVESIRVAGDIGDFSMPFDTTESGGGMGGIAAGRTPQSDAANGSVKDITANRIAAIVAGRVEASGVSAQSAVVSIAAIRARVIGADIDGNGAFDFNDVNGDGDYDIGFDVPIDGLVVVREGGIVGELPVQPLRLVEV